ncbi:TPA: TrbC/VirB2 family protein, partial [Legionella pneumophila]|nr:TrbC/VirB2 family protein [Legionella pneumophila]HCE5749429.1 TrbC/VirB2 family protein [Legionella pneumophila]
MSKLKRWSQSLGNLYLIAVCTLLPTLSHAQSIESIINRTINYLQGGLARTV